MIRMRSTRTIMIAVFVISFITFAFNGCTAKPEQDKVQANPVVSKTQTVDNAVYVVAKQGWASQDPMNLKKVIDNYQDQEVIKQLFTSKAIFMLKMGMEVNILEDHQVVVKIRPVGNDAVVWTFKSILEKK
ncbi:MAG: hypothetical protein HQL29_00695 [Candidatus Omnitrophica bacterium]|nr:hypothetical protein [Candidatus Omnitrophota bacterium]